MRQEHHWAGELRDEGGLGSEQDRYAADDVDKPDHGHWCEQSAIDFAHG
jgi:hypothetical protein